MADAFALLEATCQQQEGHVWEHQITAERLQEERAALEMQRDELQQHYMSACERFRVAADALYDARRKSRPHDKDALRTGRVLLRESNGGEGGVSVKSKAKARVLNTSDYTASSSPQEVKLVTDAPQRKEATQRRLAAASPEVHTASPVPPPTASCAKGGAHFAHASPLIAQVEAVLESGQRALSVLASEKQDLEKRVSLLQENLNSEVGRRSTVELQLAEVNAIMQEERQLVLEERERMIEEMTCEKRRLMLAFSDMLSTQGRAEPDVQLPAIEMSSAAVAASAPATRFESEYPDSKTPESLPPGAKLEVHFEGETVRLPPQNMAFPHGNVRHCSSRWPTRMLDTDDVGR